MDNILQLDPAPEEAAAVPVAALADAHVADIVERLNEQPIETAASVLAGLPIATAIAVLDESGLEAAPALLTAQPEDRLATILSGLSADRRADIFRSLDAATCARLLGLLDKETGATLRQLLAYPANSAGSIMTTEFVGVPMDWTVEQTLRYIRSVESTRETIYAIFLLDPRTRKLRQTMSLRR